MPMILWTSLKKLAWVPFVMAVAATSGPSLEAQELQDVVYLKDGSVIRGVIVEQIPDQSILIETVDGNRFRYAMDEIERIAKERPPAPSQATQPLPQQAPARPPKSPGAALGLSLLIAGGGQAYNGEWGKAAGFFFGSVALGAAAIGQANSDECLYNDDCSAAGLWIVGWLAFQVWNVVDAYQGAKRINQRAGFASLQFLPQPSERAAATDHRAHRADLMLVAWHP